MFKVSKNSGCCIKMCGGWFIKEFSKLMSDECKWSLLLLDRVTYQSIFYIRVHHDMQNYHHVIT